MARRAILFIDLLGVQKMWSVGGAPQVKARIKEYNDFIVKQLTYLPHDLHRDGEYTAIISGDGVSVSCQDYDQAIGIGIHIFTQAFYYSDKASTPFWLRGAISKWSNQRLTMNTVPLRAKEIDVGTHYVIEDEFLTVMALEKSGFKGMRLLVDTRLLENQGRNYKRQWDDFAKPLGIVTKLKEFEYYKDKDYADILWMADDKDRFSQLKGIMASRFKRSSKDSDEFSQAAWTRATFDQVETLIYTCKQKSKK